MRRQNGFTLLEVMVAILLMAVVSLIAWRGLDSVSRADRHVRQSTEDNQAVLRVFQQLERDLALRATTELLEPARPGQELIAKPILPALRVRADRLELIRAAAGPGSGLQRVRWWVRGGTLYRAAAPSSDSFPLAAAQGGVALLQGVQAFALRSWKEQSGWQVLDSTAADNPKGLEIRLSLRSAQGQAHYRQVLGPFN
ncbi:prepilin-type N-terminal cleavage/methylation domain-containing protein [Pantoea sp. Tr-811]|uniref:type II secretion system protein GspJ n=1 Tax=Pantoea sp. Tr-811 TaxID=2608361 RepID=UPI0014240353|nr:type II secretion system protein GspJ [Pantoea sp. Tr-811]NIF25124.1 prepilin-type N-terminal cleavage/methylation domain-containing protein [Pantoea sp. Tr-811]